MSLLINQSIKHLQDIEIRISELEAEENREQIIKNFKRFGNNPENINLQEMWKVLKSICPKYENVLPIAKQNYKGDIISDPDELRILLTKEYKQRLRPTPIRPDLGDLKERRDEIFDIQLKLAEENSSKPWTMDDLERALSSLKNNKARDHSGSIN